MISVHVHLCLLKSGVQELVLRPIRGKKPEETHLKEDVCTVCVRGREGRSQGRRHETGLDDSCYLISYICVEFIE